MAKCEWCKNSMLMSMWLKLNNHLHSKQKRTSIMQMTEAFMLFSCWRGFCNIQETVTQRGNQKGEISNWYSFIVTESILFILSCLYSQFRTLFNFRISLLTLYKSPGDIYGCENGELQLTFEAAELISLELLHGE